MTTKKQLTFGILIAFAAVLSLGITTTTTYAQQGKACPEGFQLNKGTCQAEPELTCDPYGVGPTRIELVDGECKHLSDYGPDCFEFQDRVIYDIFDDRCETDGQPVEASLPEDLTCRNDDPVIRIDNVWRCAFYEFLPAFEECAL